MAPWRIICLGQSPRVEDAEPVMSRRPCARGHQIDKRIRSEGERVRDHFIPDRLDCCDALALAALQIRAQLRMVDMLINIGDNYPVASLPFQMVSLNRRSSSTNESPVTSK